MKPRKCRILAVPTTIAQSIKFDRFSVNLTTYGRNEINPPKIVRSSINEGRICTGEENNSLQVIALRREYYLLELE